jgi:structural maintenance of chromosomes protein 6
MCHRNFTQNFYAGVNYITGENGSGKSAVIVALSAALGANFNKIGKGDDVSNLIGTAEPIAVVTVTLRNDPRNPRHCDKYNNPVVIERTLVRRGEAGKISNKNTIKIDGKEVRKVDLVELMTIMSIDVCNPAVVLHQDNAKSFGDCNDGKGLYKYFLSATGLHQSLEECERCKAQVLADRNNLQQCKSLQTNLREGDYAEAKQAMDRCSDLNDLRAKIEGLKGDLAVASIHEVIKKFDEKNEEMIDYRESQRECSAQHDQLQRELNEMCAEVAAVELQGNTELDSEIESIKQQLYHLNKKSQGFASELSRKGNEKNQAEQAIRKLQRQIAEEEQRRDEARREFERQDRNKGKRAATKLREEAESMLQKVEQRQAEIQEVEAETEEYQRDLQRSQAQFEDVKSGLSSVDEMIKKNRSNRGKVITRDEIIRRYKPPFFNGDFVQVRNAIDALAKKGVFRGSIPLGPLGMHVTLKPEGRKFYKPIAQALGAKNLGAFLFDNSDDLNAFKRSREYQTIPNSGLFFLTLPSSTQSVSESTPTFQSLPNSPTFSCLDLLVFDNPWVKNALIHFAKVDKNQVVEHYDKSLGHKAMDSLRGKRNGVSVTVRSIDGHECTAAVGGGISATTNSGNVPQDIFDRSETVDAESSLRELELEKQGLTRDYQLVEKERRNLSDRLKQLQDRAQRLNSDIMSFQKKRKQNLAEARELELEAEQLPQDFDESFYEDSIRSKQETMNVRKEELSRYERELELISRNNSEIQIQMKKETEKRQKVEQKAQSTFLFVCLSLLGIMCSVCQIDYDP